MKVACVAELVKHVMETVSPRQRCGLNSRKDWAFQDNSEFKSDDASNSIPHATETTAVMYDPLPPYSTLESTKDD